MIETIERNKKSILLENYPLLKDQIDGDYFETRFTLHPTLEDYKKTVENRSYGFGSENSSINWYEGIIVLSYITGEKYILPPFRIEKFEDTGGDKNVNRRMSFTENVVVYNPVEIDFLRSIEHYRGENMKEENLLNIDKVNSNLKNHVRPRNRPKVHVENLWKILDHYNFLV